MRRRAPWILGLCALVAAYGAAFPWLYRHLGPGSETLAILVVLFAAAWRGLVPGLVVASACLLLQFVEGHERLGMAWSAWLDGGAIATAIGLPLVGLVVGRLRDLRVRLDREVLVRGHTERELREAQKVAEAASTAKSEFLARMSHEIRTPMHGVLGMAQVLGESSLSVDQREQLDMMHESGQLLLAVINDILDFSKIEAGRMELELADFSLKAALKEARELLAVAARHKGITLRLDAATDLVDHVVGDALRLRQVLLNLVGNAVKFTERGGVVVRATTVSLGEQRMCLRVEVVDSGIGINPSVIPRIFEPFGQADPSTTRVYGGTGLGLTICRQLVELMHGRIGCDSVVGQGSTFWFEVELQRSEAIVDPAPLQATPVARASGRVLVAEDNPINQVIARRLLETLGLQVDIVGDGAAAVKAVAAADYDVLLLDCQMPVLDGYEAARRIRAAQGAGRRLAILAVTASAMPGEAERCREAGMDAVLLKPLQADALRAEVARFLPRKKWQSVAVPVALAPVELPIIEIATLAELKRAGGRDVVRTVVGLFEEAAVQAGAELRAVLDDGPQLASLAHRQRGSAACVGARRLAAALTQLEAIAQSGDHAAAAATVERIGREVDDALRILARYRSGDSAAFEIGAA